MFFGDEASSLIAGDTLKATEENVNKTIADLQSLKAFGGTNMEAAFDLLFETFEPYLPNVEDSGLPAAYYIKLVVLNLRSVHKI